jgi:hypothetical protein
MIAATAVSDRIGQAAQALYDAECALHAAHQAGDDVWTAAAADRLHEAIERLSAVEAEASRHSTSAPG